MAEVFEIQVVNTNKIPFDLIMESLKFIEVKLNVIDCIDNWSYENLHGIELKEKSINDVLNNGKIVVLEGDLLNNKCGCFISKEDEEYCYDFWLSTNNLRCLACESINDANYKIYTRVLNALLNILNKNELIYCAIGVEIFVDKNKPLMNIIENSTGVIRWVVPEKENIKLNEYIEENVQGFKIYSIYS